MNRRDLRFEIIVRRDYGRIVEQYDGNIGSIDYRSESYAPPPRAWLSHRIRLRLIEWLAFGKFR